MEAFPPRRPVPCTRARDLDCRPGFAPSRASTVKAMATELSSLDAALDDVAPQPSICFVACVESGPLEAQTVRLAESIRRFGGALSGGEILAIPPRSAPPLSRETRRRFAELGVRHERLRSHPKYAWYHYLNTPIALAAAERLTDADVICWTDSDLLFMAEPTELALDPTIDFIAGSTDNGVV